MNNLDSREFRNALGHFATGVTVITSIDEQSRPVGVTASSFNSVSIDPPLVLWSLAKESGSLSAFKTSGYFCVHVLASSHESLSQRFAARGTDKFNGIDWQKGQGSAPLLPDYAARFQCKLTYQYEGGDHIIFVGEVLEYDTRNEAPLVFHQGKYATAKTKNRGEPAGDAVDIAEGKFSDNFFLYLLSRAHFQASYELSKELERLNLETSEYLSLTLIGLSGPMSLQDLCTRLEHTANAPDHKNLNSLIDRGLLTETVDASKLSLTVKGRNLYIQLLAKSKAVEEKLLANFSTDEVADVRSFLKRFIEISDPGVPSLGIDSDKH